MTVSSRIGVMRAGQLQQIGTPGEVYEYPHTGFVADFIGDTSLFEIESAGPRRGLHGGQVEWARRAPVYLRAVDDSPVDQRSGQGLSPCVPEKVTVSREEAHRRAERPCEGKVVDIAYTGSQSVYHVELCARCGDHQGLGHQPPAAWWRRRSRGTMRCGSAGARGPGWCSGS